MQPINETSWGIEILQTFKLIFPIWGMPRVNSFPMILVGHLTEQDKEKTNSNALVFVTRHVIGSSQNI